MILDKNKAEGAAEEYLDNDIWLHGDEVPWQCVDTAFKSGVSYAESELRELAIEFGNFLQGYSEPIYKIEGVFKEFLKSKENVS